MPMFFGQASSDDVPDELRCPDDCVLNAVRNVKSLVTRKIEHDGEAYVNIDDLGAVFAGLLDLQAVAMIHSPEMPTEVAEIIHGAMTALTMNMWSYLVQGQESLVDAEAPDSIPDWMTKG